MVQRFIKCWWIWKKNIHRYLDKILEHLEGIEGYVFILRLSAENPKSFQRKGIKSAHIRRKNQTSHFQPWLAKDHGEMPWNMWFWSICLYKKLNYKKILIKTSKGRKDNIKFKKPELSLGNIFVPNIADKISISRVHKTFYNSKRKMSEDINREIRGKNK